MEYIIKDQLESLISQRETLVHSVSDMNENLPNYSIRIMELNNQILNVDNKINELVFVLKDIKMTELQNELVIKTQIK